ncbi:MAG: helicase [Hydrogenobacter thermophilus]|uniref:C-terminal helicase domain-containing protein n=1 Tax=Hydrogenobacter thermophilus TaxID=940 RepID=UPI001C75FBD7|nr:helicase-related protein [Hydrogenobacter thermophilus]QWK19547.1 MAG: helicase [Hydrogenobacter thermophilus]
MANKFVQFLGFAFEGAFKLGFLKDRIEDYQQFKERQVFEKLKQEFIHEHFQELEYIWELLERNIPFDPKVEQPEELRELGLQDDHKTHLLFVFLVGYYEGYFYGLSFGDLELIKYTIGEESSQAGVYYNADLIFKSNKTLYVADFKLSGVRSQLTDIITKKDLKIPFRNYGLPVNLALGELTFEGFLKSLTLLEDELLSLQEASPELKGFLQVVSYAVDYLHKEKPEDIKEVCLSLLYPLAEPFIARFYLRGEDLSQYREKIISLYDRIRRLELEYKQVESSSLARIERLREEIPKEIENLKQQIKVREKQETVLSPDSIYASREHVGKVLDRFFNDPDPVKAVCLFHSAGSGKTTQTRKKILQMEGKHIILYMATRKILLNRELEEIRKLKDQYKIEIVYEKSAKKDSEWVRNIGDTYKDLPKDNAGILKKTVEKIRELTTKDHNFIWAFATQQAIVGTLYKDSTAEYLKGLLSKRIINQYTFHFILDEFFGYNNGLFAIEELFKILNYIKNEEGRVNLYLFDANGFAPPLLEKLLEEYKEFQVMPDATILCEYSSGNVFKERDIKVYVSAKHGYPSPRINLVKKFIFLSEEEVKLKKKPEDELINKKIAEYIEETFKNYKEESTALVFVQNREYIALLKELLEEKGFSSMVATANSKRSQREINEGNQDIILSTSAISRGIDLSRPHKPVNHIYTVIYDWGIEKNMVELIQAISRARGDKKTESEPKTIHLIYLVYPTKNENIDRIIAYLEEDTIHKDLIRLLNEKINLREKIYLDDVITQIITQFIKTPEEKSKVLVPLGEQYKSVYIPNKISEIEGCLSFLNDIRELEKDDELKKNIRILIGVLTEALYVSVIDISFDKEMEYYHPYILFNNQRVRFGFDNESRGRAKSLFYKVKEKLEEHNPEKTEDIEEIINSFLPVQESALPVLVPIYSIVLVKHFLKINELLGFTIDKRIGRGRAETLLGSENPRTYCFNGEQDREYACIPLGEEYPYKEVLSGRFVKFPIEFIKYLLE